MTASRSVASLFALAFIIYCALAHADPLSRQADFNIAPQRLAAAILQFSEQARVQVISSGIDVTDQTTPGVIGRYTVADALNVLLKGTGLRYKAVNESTVSLQAIKQGGNSTKAEAAQHSTMALAQGDPAQNPRLVAADTPSSPSSPFSGAEKSGLTEIIVTASKRPEQLREVANSVTAFGESALQQLGAQSFGDYIGRAPGVIFDASTPGLSNVTIRGIGTATAGPDQGQGTTGIYLNDIPLTDPGFAMGIPDVDVFDIQRVEVLRGPQGTLFGTATLGGAVNYILNPVSLDTYAVHLQTGLSSTHGSDQTGYAVKGAVNLPLITNTLGFRLTAIKRFDPGYLDNIGTGVKDANSHVVEDFRIAGLWQITDKLSLSYFSFYDKADNADGFDAFPSIGDLKRNTFLPEFSNFLNKVNSLKLDADLNFATLSLSGAYSQKRQDSVLDFTLFGYNVPTSSPAFARTNSTSVEARLTSPSDQKFEWLIGVYHGLFSEHYPTPTIQSGVDIYDYSVQYHSVETSGFGEATYHFSDQWRATVGGRYYHIDFRTGTEQGVPGTPSQDIFGSETADGLSSKASITFEPSRNFLTYALVSKGFRSGGVNLVPPLAGFPTPATYAPDKLVNYEIGVRPAWFDHRLTLDSALFYVDWSDIQIRLNRPDFLSYATNAGKAHNIGVENTLMWRPDEHLELQVNATYLDAEIAQTLDLGNGTIVPKGSTLPGASRWTTAELATYRWTNAYSPFLALSHRSVSSALSGFAASTGGAVPVGNYHAFDFRTGLSLGHFDVSAYLDNLADRRGVTAGQVAGPYVQDFYIRPRTVGVRLDWRL